MTDTVEREALTREQLLSAYRMMRAIREFEERVHAEFATGEIPGFVHLYAGRLRPSACAATSTAVTPSPAPIAAMATASPRAWTSAR
jgi:TPP-dependent pyruvate/acetoin dehydrogenase alpha subunit